MENSQKKLYKYKMKLENTNNSEKKDFYKQKIDYYNKYIDDNTKGGADDVMSPINYDNLIVKLDAIEKAIDIKKVQINNKNKEIISQIKTENQSSNSKFIEFKKKLDNKLTEIFNKIDNIVI
jgi:hypothetical protein